MADLKTKALEIEFSTFMAQIEPVERREEAPKLDAMFRKATGFAPRVWSGGMIGYGRYEYTYKSGRSGSWFATGFAPRKSKLSIYIMPGYANFQTILERLGKHTIGKSCLYANKLADLDMTVLEELIQAGLQDLQSRWPVSAT